MVHKKSALKVMKDTFATVVVYGITLPNGKQELFTSNPTEMKLFGTLSSFNEFRSTYPKRTKWLFVSRK